MALNERLDTLRVLAGSEVNINTDGSLDYEDDVLAELDWVVASVHTSFRMGEKGMTERMMAAMDHPFVDAIGHPTGRLILRREPTRSTSSGWRSKPPGPGRCSRSTPIRTGGTSRTPTCGWRRRPGR